MKIIRYTDEFRDETIGLILHIQNDEAKVNMPLEGQPDLLDITQSYINSGGNFWLAVADGHVVGTLALMRINDEWSVLKKFFVREDFRSQKVGLALYTRLLDFAKAKGFRHIILDTPSVAKKAHAFYVRAGFRQIEKSQLPVGYDYLDRESLLFQLDI